MRRCWVCGNSFAPSEGGYNVCNGCKANGDYRRALVGRRKPKSYIESRECAVCGGDYLYPVYGGIRICNTCSMNGDYQRARHGMSRARNRDQVARTGPRSNSIPQ